MNLSFELDSTQDEPLHRQLFRQLRVQILEGSLAAATRLPATRALAKQLHIARITVTQAYDQLQAEGYVVRRRGAGTFVASQLQLNQPETATQPPEPASAQLSAWGRRMMQLEHLGDQPEQSHPVEVDIDFGFGRSFPHIFPYAVWRSLLARYLSTDDVMLSRYGSVAGFAPLREVISDYLARLRGVHCHADEVIIVNGAQQAVDIIARLLLDKGDEVLVETPGYTDAFSLFAAHGARLKPLPVDNEGFPAERIPPSSAARLAFVTPANQFPRGGAMPAGRRLALLQWARRYNAQIIEDDYDGALRYEHQPLGALQGLDDTGRVIYLGTFSKVLFPALRLGYVVLPGGLLPPFLKAKSVVDRGAPTLTQAAVADFIQEGHFERHLKRLRKEYGRRRRTLVAAIEAELGSTVSFAPEPAGLHIMAYLPPEVDEASVVAQAALRGVRVYAGQPYHLQRPAPPSILLGFSGLSEPQIEEGVRRLAEAMRQATNTRRTD